MRTGTFRARFLCNRCQKWKDFCQGHSVAVGNKEECAPDCAECWREVQQKILLFVSRKKWRVETTITSYVCRVEPTWTMERVVDELFILVKQKKLEWFGNEDSLSKPLKYTYLQGLRQPTDNTINLPA